MGKKKIEPLQLEMYEYVGPPIKLDNISLGDILIRIETKINEIIDYLNQNEQS